MIIFENKILIILNFIFIITIFVLIIFIFYNNNNNCSNNNEDDSFETLTFNINKECQDVCENTININNDSYKINVSNKLIKINDNNSISIPSNEKLWEYIQVSVIKDIIVVLNQNCLSRWLDFYDFEGNIIYTVDYFADNKGRIFTFYDDSFKIDKNGNIEFEGTKHTQGISNSYITETGIVDVCEQNINDSEIVSGIFQIKYIGNNTFSQINYKETIEVVSDIKSCN